MRIPVEISVLGYSARLPGAASVSEFWRLLDEGRCAITRIPEERFPTARYWHPNRQMSGRAISFAAGVVENAYDFDRGFFGITRREATQMDPQQRMLLQVVWEALENAGIPPSSLRSSGTGVFVGASSLDHMQQFTTDAGSTDAQLVTGNTLSIISNRISYFLDLQGPSLTVDTACSSSLVALHQACAAIASGQIDTAIVGGVNFLAAPYPFCGFSRAFMLSEQGLCRAFDANGDGYVRGEGAVALVIQSSKAARRADRRARSRIVAWGTNCDGRTSGLSLPSMAGQAALLDTLYRDFEIDPNDLAFVEAHGTGTRVGDPIEATALGNALGQRRTSALLIGSVKTNIGHLEPASGLAGLLKAALALDRNRLPASLHFETPNPDIRFDELNIEVACESRELPRTGRPRLAGVNSFGFGGANAHVVLADGDPPRPPQPREPGPIMVSAASKPGLQALAKTYADILSADHADSANYAGFAAATLWRRDKLDHRALILTRSREETVEALGALAEGKTHAAAVVAKSVGHSGASVFAFAGNGSQWAGMGQSAYSANAAFRRSLEETDALFAPLVGWSLIKTMLRDDVAERIKHADVVQPLLFAIQVATADALASCGVVPSAVLGHSAGEVAAACVAGAISRKDALRIIAVRSSFQEPMRGKGTMAALVLPEAEAEEALSKAEFNQVEIAAVNTGRSLTLSGPIDAISSFLKHARRKRWPYVRLDIEYPFHSSLLDPLREDVLAALIDVRPRASSIPFISTVTGGMLAGETLDANYWWRNVRERVRFERGVLEALKSNPRVLLEISPAPILNGYLVDIARQSGSAAVALASLERHAETHPEPVTRIAASVLCHGGAASLEALGGPERPEDIDLPNYPWQNERIKLESSTEAETKFLPDTHPLLGMPYIRDGLTFYRHLDTETVAWLNDHKVQNAVVFPAAGLLELALAGARQSLGDHPIELRDCQILRPLGFTPDVTRLVITNVLADERLMTVESRPRGSQEPAVVHARTGFSLAPSASAALSPAMNSVVRRADAEAVYSLLDAYNLHYGSSFRRLKNVIETGDGHCEVEFEPPALDWPDFLLDPAVVDAAFHAFVWLMHGDRPHPDGAITYLPTFIERVRLFRPHQTIVRARVQLTRKPGGSGVLDNIWLLDDLGKVVAHLSGGRFARVQLVSSREAAEFYNVCSVPLPRAAISPMAAISPDRMIALDAHEEATFAEAALERAALQASAHLTGDRSEASDGIADLLKSCPELIDEASACALAANGEAQLNTAALLNSPRALSLFSAACSIVDRTLSEWPTHAPLRILLLGAPDEANVRRLTSLLHPLRGDITLCDFADARLDQLLSRLQRDAVPMLPLAQLAVHAGSFDLVVVCDALNETEAETFDARALSGTLSSGGRIMRISFADNTFARLVGARLVGAASTAADFAARFGVNPLSGAIVRSNYGPLRIEVGQQDAESAEPVMADSREARLFAYSASDEVIIAKALKDAGSYVSCEGDLRTDEDIVFVSPAPCAVQDSDCSKTLAELTAVVRNAGPGPRRLTVIGQGGVLNPVTAALRGFLRVATNEYPNIRWMFIAIDHAHPAILSRVAREVLHAPHESELTVTSNAVFASRTLVNRNNSKAVGASQCLRLEIAGQGSLERLRWAHVDRRAPERGEVEIEIEAAGLNFRDVMWSLGLLPPEALEAGFAGATLGMEFAGRVVRVGEGVPNFTAGDEVIGFGPSALAQFVTTPAFVVARRPENMSAESAATLPVTFLTSWYSLVHLARVEAGETVLVHGGAGGVGLAAINILRMLGAKIIATAGSKAKRALLHELGVDHVLDSRSLLFADDIEIITDGQGVDIVLNSLAGEAMQRSVDCLKPFGRFIELGKRDFFANTRLGLRPFRQNLSYFGVDADQLLLGQKKLVERLFADLMACFADGRLSPLPWRRFEAEDVTAAFRLMQQSGHIGKIVIVPPERARNPSAGLAPRADASYLIVGGLSGLGLALAHRLARQGAGRVILVSRKGAATEGADAIAPAFATYGCDVEIHAADASIEDQLGPIIEGVPRAQPIAGVFHAAMLLDDALIENLDAERIEAVLRSKLGVAEALDRVTQGMTLDAFVMFSSASAMLGNPGQANYVAANLAMESIAHRRRARKEVALCIGFGAISDTGYLAREHATDSPLMQRLARHSLTGDEALDGLDAMLRLGMDAPVAPVFARLDWAALTRDLPILATPNLAALRRSSAETGVASDLADELRKMEPGKVRARVLAELANEIAKIMRIAPSEVDQSKGLAELGIDSLMGVELRLAAEERFGVSVPLLSIGAAGSLNDLATLVIKQVLDGDCERAASEEIGETV